MSTPIARMLSDDEILIVLDHAKEELGITRSRVNESIGFKVMDFPIGAEVYIGDEVWKVVKPGARGEKIIMAPFNAEAKRKYISRAIEFDLSWLDGNVTEIDK